VGLQYRTSRTVGRGTRINASGRRLSVSQRVGPLTFNSRGSTSLRLAKGLSYRVGRKNSAAALAVAGAVLAVSLMVWLARVVVVLLGRSCVVAVWCARWVWASTSAAIDRRGNAAPAHVPSAAAGSAAPGPQPQGIEITRPQ
jgi:hypothetical protein